MRIGMLGTGVVGAGLATKLVQLGHEVKMGSRDKNSPKAAEWAGKNGGRASTGTFSEAAAFGEIVFNCTHGADSLNALMLAGEQNLGSKILVDVANPLDFSTGELRLTVSNTDSLGEQIQRAFPSAKVVKTLNTMGVEIMVNPSLLPEEHAVFMSGDDEGAKATVLEILKSFGWKSAIDLGGIKSARGAEAILLLWIHLYGKMPDGRFNYRIVRNS
ncbi:MAG TPA: NAD(P)-binding domain-containing protein [Candidatus Acidoferrales bacterium]|nr:NAD(P)-binding domain-containing protein [Candidatus Acidoferrales bacterium]